LKILVKNCASHLALPRQLIIHLNSAVTLDIHETQHSAKCYSETECDIAIVMLSDAAAIKL